MLSGFFDVIINLGYLYIDIADAKRLNIGNIGKTQQEALNCRLQLVTWAAGSKW